MGKDQESKKVNLLKKATKTSRVVALSLFILPPLLSGEMVEKSSETIKSTEPAKVQKLAMEKSNKIIKPRYFWEDFDEMVKRREKIEKITKAVLSAEHVGLEKAIQIVDTIESPDKEKMLDILNDLKRKIENEEIRTYENKIDEEGNTIIRPVELPFSLTYYSYPPEEKAIILTILEPLNICNKNYKKGTYIIYQRKEKIKFE